MSRAIIFHCNDCRKMRRPFVKETNFRHHLIQLHNYTEEDSIRQVDEQRREFFRRTFSKLGTNDYQIRPSVIVQPQSRIAPKPTSPEIITISDDDDDVVITSNEKQQKKFNPPKTIIEVSNLIESSSTLIQLEQCSSNLVRMSILKKPSIQKKELPFQVQRSESCNNMNAVATSLEEKIFQQNKNSEVENSKMFPEIVKSVSSTSSDQTQNPNEERFPNNDKEPQPAPTLILTIPMNQLTKARLVARRPVKPQLHLVNNYFFEKRQNNGESSQVDDCCDDSQL